MKRTKTNKRGFTVPEGCVGITVTIEITDPSNKKKSQKSMEKFLAVECTKFLQILFDTKAQKAFFETKDDNGETKA